MRTNIAVSWPRRHIVHDLKLQKIDSWSSQLVAEADDTHNLIPLWTTKSNRDESDPNENEP